MGNGLATVPDIRKEYAMGRLVCGAAALTLGMTLASVASAQTAGPAKGASPLVPPVTPQGKPEVRPTGNAATVNNQAIPEVAVYRALRQFPPAQQEMARKEIMAHLIDNLLIDQYLTAIKVTV